MKNQMRKMMAMLLTVVMLLSSVPFTVFAEEPTSPAVETPVEPEKQPEAPAEKSAEEPAKTEEKPAEAPEEKQNGEPVVEAKPTEEPIKKSSETQITEQENAAPDETKTADPTEQPAPEATKETDAESTSEPTAAPPVEATEEATVEPTIHASTEPSAEPTADATAEPSGNPSVEPTTESSVEPSTDSTIEPSTETSVEPTVEPTPEVAESVIPEVSSTPEVSASPEVTPEVTPIPKIRFTAPKDGDIVPGQEDLKVEWEIEGSAEGLLFSARDLQRNPKEEDSFIYREPVSGSKYEISGSGLPYDTDFELKIEIVDASGNIVSEDKIEICTDSKPVIEEPKNTEESIIEEDEMPVVEDVPLLTRSFSLRASAPTGTLAAPQNLVLDGYYLSWDEVEGTEHYIVEIEELGERTEWDADFLWLSNYNISEAGTYTVKIYATNSGSISEASTIRFTVSEEDILSDLVLSVPETHTLVTDLVVNWNDIGNVDSYSIYLQDPNWRDIYWDVIWDGEVTSTTFPKEYFTTAGTYRIRIEASGEINSSTAEIEIEVIGDNSSILPAPQNLSVSVDCIFTWDAVEGAEVYEVYLDGEKIGSTSTCAYCFNSLSDLGYQAFGEYTAAVCAVSGEGISEKAEIVFEYKEIAIDVPDTHTVNTPLEISWTDIGLQDVDHATINLYCEASSIYSYYYFNNTTSHTIPAEEFSAEGEYRVTLWIRTEGNPDCSWNVEATFQVTSNGEQLAAPVIHDIDAVLDDYYLITWDSVPNATSYLVDYVDPDGYSNYRPYETIEPQYSYSCSQVGNASITVTALGPGYLSSTATKEFIVRALGTLEAPQVSIEGLSAENTIPVSTDLKISWNEIENADEYQINLESENNNWGTNYWDPEYVIKAEYLDQPGEYMLTVTAEKDGWIPGETTITFTVVSEVDPLPVPTNIALDDDYCLTWDTVPGAEVYYILFEGWNDETTETYYDLKELVNFYWITAGDYSLTLTAAAEGVPSSEATFEFTITEDEALAAPTNIILDEDYNLIWDPVEGAEQYVIQLDGETDTTEENEYYLPNHWGVNWLDVGKYTLTLTAIAEGTPSAKVDYEFEVTEDMVPDFPEFIDLPEIHGMGEHLTIQWTDCGNVEYSFINLHYSEDDEPCYDDVAENGETNLTIPGYILSEIGQYTITLWVVSDFGVHRYVDGSFDVQEILETLDAPVIHDISEVRVNAPYTFTWDPVENAEKYYVEVNVPYDEDIFAEYKFDDWVTDTSFTIELRPDDLPGNASITVSACAEGYASGSSTVEFEVLPVYGTLDAPAVVFEDAIAENMVYFNRDLNLSWPVVENAVRYDLNIEKPNGSNVGTRTTENKTTFDKRYFSDVGDYVLTVKAQAPGWLDGVTTMPFTVVECPPLEAPEIEEINDFYENEDLTISWNEIKNAEEYKISLHYMSANPVNVILPNTTGTHVTVPADHFMGNLGMWAVQVTAIANDYQDGVSKATGFNVLAAFRYIISNGKAILTDYLADDNNVVVPNTLGGYPVSEVLTGAFEGNKNITSVYLPDSVKSIGEAAFKNCTTLESITGYGVTTIGDEAFAGCTNLRNINLGPIEEVGKDAFSGVTDDLFHWEMGGSSETTVGGCEGSWDIFELTIREGVTTIAEKAFKNCFNIQKIYLPTSLRRIESQAFAGCTSVNMVRLYEDCTYITDDAFSGDGAVTFILYQRDVNAMSYVRQYALDHNIPCTVVQWPTELETPIVEWATENYTVYKHVPVTINVYAAKSNQVRMFIGGKDVGVYDVDAKGNTSFSYTFSEEGTFDVYFRSEKGREQISTPINTVTVLTQSISFTTPLDEAEIPMAELSATWTSVYGVDHYEFSARYLDEEEPFIFHQKADISGVTIPAEKIIGGKDLQLWVGAYNAAGTLICAETIQVKFKNTISFITPKQGETVDGEKALKVAWTEVYGAKYYRFAGRYLHHETQFIYHEELPTNITEMYIPVTQMLGEKTMQLWVAAYDANDKLICSETIQVNTSAVQELTIEFTSPKNGDMVAYNEPLTVSWTEVWLADHYEFSARYEDEEIAFIERRKISKDDLSTTIDVSFMKENKLLNLWIDACDEYGNVLRESTIQQKIQVTTTQSPQPKVLDFKMSTDWIWIGKEVKFEIFAENAEKIQMVVDGVAYDQDIIDVTADPQEFVRAFHNAGERSVQFKAYGYGKWSEPCEAQILTVTEVGKIPNPEILNLEPGEILLNNRKTVYWEVEGNEEDLGIDHYLFGLYRKENGKWVSVNGLPDLNVGYNTGMEIDDGLLKSGEYMVVVTAVAEGVPADSSINGKASIEFAYRTVPEFSLTSIENDTRISTPVTVHWNPPVWQADANLKPDKYIVWWYGPGLGEGKAYELSGDSTQATLPAELCAAHGDYHVDVYAILGEGDNWQQRSASGNNTFTKAEPRIILNGKTEWLLIDAIDVQGYVEGGLAYMRLQLLENGKDAVQMKGGMGVGSNYIVVPVGADRCFYATLTPAQNLKEGSAYTVEAYAYFDETQTGDLSLHNKHASQKLTVTGSQADTFMICGTKKTYGDTWRYIDESMYVVVQGNRMIEKLVVRDSLGNTYNQISKTDIENNKRELKSESFSYSKEGKYSLTISVDGKNKSRTVYVVTPQNKYNVFADKDGAKILSLPVQGATVRASVEFNTLLEVKGSYGDYYLVNYGKTEGFVHMDSLMPEASSKVVWEFTINEKKGTVSLFVEPAKGSVAPEGDYVLAVLPQEYSGTAKIRFFNEQRLLLREANNYQREFDLGSELRLEEGKKYYFAVVPKGSVNNTYWPFDYTYGVHATILYPHSGDELDLFTTGSMIVAWGICQGATRYELKIEELGDTTSKVIYCNDKIKPIAGEKIVLQPVTLKDVQQHYTKQSMQENHDIQIWVTALRD